jgi:YD repeat-containing protein
LLGSSTVAFDKTVSRTYENAGMMDVLSDSVGNVDFGYNNRGLLQRVSVDGPPAAFELGYDNSGLKTSVVSEIGVTETRGYDAAGRLTSVGYS